ncbi:S-layer homology domain-containing protein [Brevibacillus sp. B_LB10_24]|uniref:S-layer homology domain-containing protein n=1 Tax=Brevibacillus sp. B_LB10_24 TaxID=3380645 RepID=UPI0038B7C833
MVYRRVGSWLLAFLLVFLMIPLQAAQSERSGAELERHWAKQVLERWLDKGLLRGYSDGSILPDNPITRAEMVALINRAVGFNEQAAAHFSDVHTSDWFAREIAVATAAGYVNGYGDGTFLPNHAITRQVGAGERFADRNCGGECRRRDCKI